MSNNHKKWVKSDMFLGNLSLWDENPRFPEEYFKKPEKDLIDYYLKDEKRFELRKFTKEVVAEFDLPQVEKIIVLRLRGKDIVLEGNRRIAVYKLLANPSLAKEGSDITLFKDLTKKISINEHFKIEANIAPNKNEAFRLIDRKHKNRNNEVPWGELERRNDSVRRSQGTIQDIRRVGLGKLIRALDLPKEIVDKTLGKGYITTLYRIVDSDPAQVRLGYKVSKEGAIKVKNEKRFTNLLKIIVYNVYTKKRFGSKKKNIDSRHLNTLEEIEVYLKSISEKDVVKVEKAIKESQEKSKKVKKFSKIQSGSKLLPNCFIIMPLKGLDPVYRRIQSAWKEVFGKKAKVYHQGDDGNKGGRELIDLKILKNIRNSHIVVSVLSMGAKEKKHYESVDANKREAAFKEVFPFNANVALETGYAMRCVEDGNATLKDYFLIADKSGKVSAYKFAKDHFFDLAHRDITPYSESNLDELEKVLIKHFKGFKKQNRL